MSRHKELHQGLTDTETLKLLLEEKSVTDEFRIIHDVTTDIKKSSLQLAAAG